MAEGRRDKAAACPVVRLCGWSGSGKTTLGVGLLKELRRTGLSVGVVKHTASGFDLQGSKGRDSDRYLEAGAAAVVLCGPAGTALLLPATAAERRPAAEILPAAEDLSAALVVLAEAVPAALDLVLVEGFKGARGAGGAAIVVRDEGREPPPVAGRVIAQVTAGRRGPDSPARSPRGSSAVPTFDREDISAIARLVMGELGAGR